VQAEELVSRLDFARENATAGLDRGCQVLESSLHEAGHVPQKLPFSCHAQRADAAGLVLIAAAAFLAWAVWRGNRGALAGFIVAVLLALGAGAGILDPLLAAHPQTSLQLLVEPLGTPVREILLCAHYDTKTELLDHVERSALIALAAILCALTCWLVLKRRTGARWFGSAAAVALLVIGTHFAGSRLIDSRSHGIVDDGAACALLVELACWVHSAPMQSTRVRFVWWSGEEVGAQGSSEFAATNRPSLPRCVVNLEAVGAGSEVAYAPYEWTHRGLAAADRDLIEAMRLAAKQPLRSIPYPLISDAGSFLRHRTPALTLSNIRRGALMIRGLHSKRDRLPALDVSGIEATRQTLQTFLRNSDDS
jgi:hypothetical protein